MTNPTCANCIYMLRWKFNPPNVPDAGTPICTYVPPGGVTPINAIPAPNPRLSQIVPLNYSCCSWKASA